MFACRNLDNGERVYGHLPVRLVQAPVHQGQPADLITPNSYVDVLINQGFEPPLGLRVRVKGWLQLLEMWQPTVIIADHSPTVLLAQRLYERATCIVGGNGFCIPPVLHPFPPFDQRKGITGESLIRREQALLDSAINPVLQALDGQPMTQCQQLFARHAQWLFGLQSLDHYPGRRAQTFLGRSPSMGGEPALWPDAAGPRVFVYLKAHHPLVPHAIELLRELQWPTLIYAPDWPEGLKREAQGPSMRISNKPLDLQSVAKSGRLAINNGGMNTVIELLMHGMPQLLLPLHIEQSMISRSVEATGACLVHPLERKDPERLRRSLEALADPDGATKRAAVEFSREEALHNAIVRPADLLTQLESIG